VSRGVDLNVRCATNQSTEQSTLPAIVRSEHSIDRSIDRAQERLACRRQLLKRYQVGWWTIRKNGTVELRPWSMPSCTFQCTGMYSQVPTGRQIYTCADSSILLGSSQTSRAPCYYGMLPFASLLATACASNAEKLIKTSSVRFVMTHKLDSTVCGQPTRVSFGSPRAH
jgi:hypothetical protein